jgi:hypothetical protein
MIPFEKEVMMKESERKRDSLKRRARGEEKYCSFRGTYSIL